MSRRIMIVENEAVVALDIENLLLTVGFQIAAVVCTGREAIQMAEETIPDLVLVDIGLKGPMDGIELAQALREGFNIPIVYLTARTDEQTLARAELTRPLGYITKPFGQAELLSSIELALQIGGNWNGAAAQPSVHVLGSCSVRRTLNKHDTLAQARDDDGPDGHSSHGRLLRE